MALQKCHYIFLVVGDKKLARMLLVTIQYMVAWHNQEEPITTPNLHMHWGTINRHVKTSFLPISLNLHQQITIPHMSPQFCYMTLIKLLYKQGTLQNIFAWGPACAVDNLLLPCCAHLLLVLRVCLWFPATSNCLFHDFAHSIRFLTNSYSSFKIHFWLCLVCEDPMIFPPRSHWGTSSCVPLRTLGHLTLAPMALCQRCLRLSSLGD